MNALIDRVLLGVTDILHKVLEVTADIFTIMLENAAKQRLEVAAEEEEKNQAKEEGMLQTIFGSLMILNVVCDRKCCKATFRSPFSYARSMQKSS